MNQKDYKEIARINKTLLNLINAKIKISEKLDRLKTSDDFISFRIDFIDSIKKLADYFEKEKGYVWSLNKGKGFDKKQFLKDCGVDEE